MVATDRALPHSKEAERWTLGGILAGGKGYAEVFDLLEPDDYLIDAHRRTYRAMYDLRERGQKPDLLNLDDMLKGQPGFEDARERASFLAGLPNGMPQVAPLVQWAKRVREFARLRQIIYAADAVQEKAFAAGDSAGDILDRSISDLSEIAREIAGDSDDGSTYHDAAVALLGELRDDKRPRIFTGVHSLDRIIGGLLPGELWIFAAATGVGKTVLAQQTRRRACADGHHVLYASGEMKATHLQRRELAARAAVPQGKMRQPEAITELEFSRLVSAGAEQCKVCRILDGELELARIRRGARRMKSKVSLSLLVIDYDELVAVEGETENDQQRNLARAAKSIGMELDCAVILVSQLRKALAGEDVKRPTLQSIYGSGAKTKHSTGVLLVDRPYVRELVGDETDAQLFVLKNRDGRLGRIPCKFDIKRVEFADESKTETEPHQAPQLFDPKMRAAGGDR